MEQLTYAEFSMLPKEERKLLRRMAYGAPPHAVFGVQPDQVTEDQLATLSNARAMFDIDYLREVLELQNQATGQFPAEFGLNQSEWDDHINRQADRMAVDRKVKK